MVEIKNGEKESRSTINRRTLIVVVLVILAFSAGYLLRGFIGNITGAAVGTQPKLTETSPELEEGTPETCPCGCNMALDTCECATAQRIKSGTQLPQPTEQPQAERVEVSVDDDPVIGPKDAKITIIEFSDFQCPFCKRAEPTIKQVLEAYGDQVRFVYRDFPLSFHQNAQKAAEAAECADEQGKFWEYHDKLFENQQALDTASLKQYAKDLGLDTSKFNECLDSGKMTSEVQKDFQDGQSYGVSGTPAFFINGIKLVGAQPFESFKQIIDSELD